MGYNMQKLGRRNKFRLFVFISLTTKKPWENIIIIAIIIQIFVDFEFLFCINKQKKKNFIFKNRLNFVAIKNKILTGTGNYIKYL